jgi:hypothetical protein
MVVHSAAVPAGAVAARALAEEGDDPGWAGCENFQGNDLGYQGESDRIDNGLW